MTDKARDEAVWFSGLCAALAMLAAHWYPSVGINLVLLVMIVWFVWSLLKVSLDRM